MRVPIPLFSRPTLPPIPGPEGREHKARRRQPLVAATTPKAPARGESRPNSNIATNPLYSEHLYPRARQIHTFAECNCVVPGTNMQPCNFCTDRQPHSDPPRQPFCGWLPRTADQVVVEAAFFRGGLRARRSVGKCELGHCGGRATAGGRGERRQARRRCGGRCSVLCSLCVTQRSNQGSPKEPGSCGKATGHGQRQSKRQAVR